MPYNKTNFHTHTFCVFDEKPLSDLNGLTLNYRSKSGSSYYFTDDGVYRLSDHWGRAANCKWRLQTENKKHGNRLGFALWTSFHPDNETERLYFIEYNKDNRTVLYQHKNNLKGATKALFNTSDVTKRIREIRSLFASEAWTRHFDGDVNTMRDQLIEDIAVHGKTLQQAKASLFK